VGAAEADRRAPGEEHVSLRDQDRKTHPTSLHLPARSRLPSAGRGNGNDEREWQLSQGCEPCQEKCSRKVKKNHVKLSDPLKRLQISRLCLWNQPP
jgi:hypothetical protein